MRFELVFSTDGPTPDAATLERATNLISVVFPTVGVGLVGRFVSRGVNVSIATVPVPFLGVGTPTAYETRPVFALTLAGISSAGFEKNDPPLILTLESTAGS